MTAAAIKIAMAADLWGRQPRTVGCDGAGRACSCVFIGRRLIYVLTVASEMKRWSAMAIFPKPYARATVLHVRVGSAA